MATNDAELLERWTTGGDAQAFDSLVTGYSGLVFSACKRILRNDADAQDATQDCFLQLAQRTPQIQTSLAAWLHTVATRKAISRIREDSRRTRREQTYASQAETAVEADWDDIQEYIDDAIRTLPAENRVPLVASFLERETHAVIAKEIGVDRSTVSRRIDRGIELIRAHLKRNGIITTSASLLTILSTKMTEAMPVGLTASLAKIALTGGRLQTAGNVAAGGLLVSALDFFGGMTIGKAIAAGIALVAILGGAWFVNSQRDSAEIAEAQFVQPPTPVEAQSEEAPSAETLPENEPEPDPASIPVEAVEPMQATDAPPIGTTIEGRVFDATTHKGIDGVTVTAYFEAGERVALRMNLQSAEPANAVASAETEEGGRFTLPDLPLGAYRIVSQEIDGYPETYDEAKRVYVQIHTPDEQVINVEFPVERGGVLTGVAILGGKPLAETDISVDSYSGGGGMRELGELVTRTDRRGRFRFEDLRRFEGSLIAKRTQANGQRQDALVVPATIEPGKETETTFDFISGTASIQGRIYFQDEQTPIRASIAVFFGWDDDGEYKEEIIRARTDDTGYYLVEGLPAGNAELHINPSDIQGNILRTETVVLTEGQHVTKDITLTAMSLQVRIQNIPPKAVQLFLTAHPGQFDMKMETVADFMTIRNNMVTYDQLYPENRDETLGELIGLKPGQYTITASAWPASYSLAAVQAYGAEKFFEDLEMVSAYITIQETDQLRELTLNFAGQ